MELIKLLFTIKNQFNIKNLQMTRFTIFNIKS